jgi:6-phosphogluconate dehydrogenase
MFKLGIIGLGSMGFNYCLNLANSGCQVIAYNRSKEKSSLLIERNHPNITVCLELDEFFSNLDQQKIIGLFINSGQATLDVINKITPFLKQGDIILNFANEDWRKVHTIQQELKKEGIELICCGISGGLEGALNGCSLMLSGEKEIIDKVVTPILEKTTAKDFEGNYCITNCGIDTSGHLVKMIHNAIEYCLMGFIAETVYALKYIGYNYKEIANLIEPIAIAEKFYLLEVTFEILNKQDNNNQNIIDEVSPIVDSKGTGLWTLETALDYKLEFPSLAAAIFQRFSGKEEINNIYEFKDKKNIKMVEISSSQLQTYIYNISYLLYQQGLEVLDNINIKSKLQINLKNILAVWQGGCIIRSTILKDIIYNLQNQNKFRLENEIFELIPNNEYLVMSVTDSAKNYYLSQNKSVLPNPLIALMRNKFGNHPFVTIKNANPEI